jgi:hypothetical protein
MNVGLAILFVFCGALASGIFIGNFKHSEPAQQDIVTPKEEVSFKSQEIGIVGPCKVYTIGTQPGSFHHKAFTVVCPSEYNAATTLMY